MDLYEEFIKKLDRFSVVDKTDDILEMSFNRVNEKYFSGLMEVPNLKFGNDSLRTLGHYNFQTNTITISSIFKNEDQDALDFIMYHELLHKKEKFQSKNGRSFYHTPEFNRKERLFENYKEVNKKIENIIRKYKYKGKKRTKKSTIQRLFDYF